jgi:pimeloyl-ACP methyl ester carboxylesterase
MPLIFDSRYSDMCVQNKLLTYIGSILEFLPLLSLMKKEYSPKDLPFHLIVPSLPGFNFSSGPPLDRDFTMLDAAEILNSLMVQLGFGEIGYVSHGGDIGSRLSRLLGAKHEGCKAVHRKCPSISRTCLSQTYPTLTYCQSEFLHHAPAREHIDGKPYRLRACRC